MADCIIPEGYKETSLGVIPKEWEVKRLGDLVSIMSGESPSLYTLHNQGKYPYVKVEDMNLCEKYQTHSRSYSNEEKNIAKKGSIIFPKRGAAILNNKVRIANVDIQMDSNMMAIFPIKDNLLGEYLYYSIVFEQLFKIADTSTIPQINNKHIIPCKILLPPLYEQQKIAEILNVWDKAIEKQTQLIEKLELRKKGLMQQLLTGKKRLLGFSGEWKKVKFSSIIERMSNGYVYDTNNTGDIPITRIETISKGHIDYSKVGFVQYVGELEKYKLRKGDILFSHINSIAHIGKVAMFDGNKDLYHGMNLLLIRAKEIMNKHYLYYFLSSTIARRKVRSFAKQAVNQASVNTDELKEWILCIPEIEEQSAIVQILAETDREIKFARQKSELLRQQKHGLMQQLLTGKKRIKV